MIQVPSDFAVQPLRDDEHVQFESQCGTCGLRWDDGKSTEWTPTPSGRCPFECFHEEPGVEIARATAYLMAEMRHEMHKATVNLPEAVNGLAYQIVVEQEFWKKKAIELLVDVWKARGPTRGG